MDNKEIRFIDSHYNELFRIPDGGQIMITTPDGGKIRANCKYIDEYHTDIDGIIGGRDGSGNILVIHCSSGANNVVITTGGFGFAVRPNCY